MIDYPNHFQLYSYHEAVEHSAVINVGELGDQVWLHLPSGIVKHLSEPTLYSIDSKGNLNPVDSVDSESLEFDGNHPWICIDTAALDVYPGFHMYCVQFTDTILEVPDNFYFCYHTQTNTPDMPYIYMNRDDE